MKNLNEALHELGEAVGEVKSDANRLIYAAGDWLRARRWYRGFNGWANRHLP